MKVAAKHVGQKPFTRVTTTTKASSTPSDAKPAHVAIDAPADNAVAKALREPSLSSSSGPTGIAKTFAHVVGAASIAALKASFSTKPVVLIAGDQLTGKSTCAAIVAKELGGEASGTGRLMRAAAAEKQLPVEEFVKSVPASFDVELDWQAAKKIGKGDVAVFESRLAGHLGKMLQDMGRKNVVSVYLVASPRERALRYLNRELSPEVRARVEPHLAKLGTDATLEDAMRAVIATGDPDASKLASSMKDIAHRDDVDHARLKKLYDVDYQDRSAFDVVVVTDGKTPAQVQAEIIAGVRARTG